MTRKIITIFFALFATCLFASAEVSIYGTVTITSGLGPNIVTNGDMELDSNWNDEESPLGSRSDEQWHGGTYSWKISSGGGTYEGIVSDAYFTVSGVTYQYQVWVYPTTDDEINVKVRRGDAGAFLHNVEYTGLTLNDWNLISFEVTETVTGSSAVINILCVASQAFYVDDVSGQAVLNVTIN